MPIERCERNNEQGWRGFPEGKCYLASEEGHDETAKKKAIDQAIAAGINPEEFDGHEEREKRLSNLAYEAMREMEEIKEYAELVDIEIFRPGVHNGTYYSSEMLDEMIESTNACLPLILESIEKGEYPGNPGLNSEIKRSGKPIPAFINLGHQRYLKDIKSLLKGMKVRFAKKGQSLIANLEGVKDDIALMLQEVFNGRSVELITNLYNPKDGKTYKNVIRSIGFLPDNMAPGVSGMSPEITVNFAKNTPTGFLALYHKVTVGQHDNLKQEDQPMPDKDVQKKEAMTQHNEETQPSTEGTKNPPEVRLEEFESLRSKVETLEKEKKVQADLMRKQAHELDLQSIEMYCRELSAKKVKGDNGFDFILSQKLVDAVKPIISSLDNANIIEFSNDISATTREAVKTLVSNIIEMAADNTLLVPVRGLRDLQSTHTPPEEKREPKPMREMIMEFYGADGKMLAKNPSNEHEVYLKAMDAASRDGYRKINTGGK